MDQNPPNHPPGENQPRMAPPPPLPQGYAPAGQGYYGPYGMPPAPPRKSFSILRFLSILIGLGLLLFVLLLVLGVGIDLFSRGGGIGLGDRIGLVRIEGMIYQSDDHQFWIEALRELAANPRIKGIVVRIDSPGGTVGASQELYQAILKIRQQWKKPVYVSMGDLAASGGYYTASAADRIYANKGTLTGSIGVIFHKPQIGDLTQKIGYQTETVKSGRFKDSGDIMRPMTPEERQFFDALIMNTYGQFVGDVIAQRKKPLTEAMKKFTAAQYAAYKFTPPPLNDTEAFLRQIADGRVYTGEQALQLGLIDTIGTLDDALVDLGLRTGITGRPLIYEMVRKKGISDLFKIKVSDLLPGSHAPLQYMMNLP